jgi:hypothetical protein
MQCVELKKKTKPDNQWHLMPSHVCIGLNLEHFFTIGIGNILPTQLVTQCTFFWLLVAEPGWSA